MSLLRRLDARDPSFEAAIEGAPGPAAEILARAEGLLGHARSIAVRLGESKG